MQDFSFFLSLFISFCALSLSASPLTHSLSQKGSKDPIPEEQELEFQGLEDEEDEFITASGEDEKNSSGEGEKLEKGEGQRNGREVGWV